MSNTLLQWKWLRGMVVLGLAVAIGLAAGCGRTESPEEEADAEVAVDPEQVEQELAALEHRFGMYYDGEADGERLLADLAEFVERHPDRYEARRLYAQTLQLAQQSEQAYEQFVAAVELKPDDVELRLLVGDTAMQMREYETAQRHYSQAVDIKPRDARLRVRLAQSLIEQQRYDEARMILLREAIPLDSSLYSAHVALSDLYARQNKVDLAIGQIDRALELLPASDTGRAILYTRRKGALLRRTNRPGDALATLRDLPVEHHLRIDVAQDMADCWAMLGQPERAARHFELILSRDPSDDLAAAEAANWHLKAGQYGEARRRIEQLRDINPRSSALPTLERTLAQMTEE
ncbi:MAG: tetratricopeptide repeat protein [Phycisphaeraceae bacterium]